MITREEAQQVLESIKQKVNTLATLSTKADRYSFGAEIKQELEILRSRLNPHDLEFEKHIENDDGWCDWTYPIHKGYLMKCCDCGLVHEVEFQVLKNIKKKKDGSKDGVLMDDDKYQVGLRMRRYE
jgi:hypothetical protein